MINGAPTKEDQMQQQIVQAAQKLFQQYGKHRVSIDDVAKAVGKGRSSLYYYYKNKDEIWDAVLTLEFEEILAEIKKAVSFASGTEDKVKAFCLTKIKMLRAKRELYHVSTPGTESTDRNKPNYARRHRYIKKEGVLLNEIITEGIKNGELRELESAALDVLVFVLLGGIHGLEKEMSMENNYKPETAIATLCNVVMHGLAK